MIARGNKVTALRRLASGAVSLLLATPVAAEVMPGHLRCEYQVNPLGIDEVRPRLSWELTSKRRGERQSAYQVRVATSRAALAAGRADLWDSGRVASSSQGGAIRKGASFPPEETTHVVYGGKPLSSGQECWWQVRCWDREGKPSPFSAPARWTMGLLTQKEWTARWISLEAESDEAEGPLEQAWRQLSWVWFPEGDAARGAPPGTRYFRRRLLLPAHLVVTRARFLLTADDQFVLYINGREAGRSDGLPDAWRRPQTLEVAGHLLPGANALAIVAENTSPGPAGLLGVLHAEFRAGSALTLPIDSSWKVSQTAPSGWQQAAFDDREWPRAAIVARVGTGPWRELTAQSGGRALVLPPAPFLRREFRVTKPLRRAVLYATALGLYEVRLNGRRIGNDFFTPGWTDYRRRVYYQTYDVTGQVRQGSNVLGAILADGWACGYVGLGGRDRYGIGRPRFLAQLRLTYADGSAQTVATDAAWKGAYGPIREADLLMGETYDARRAMPGWEAPGFDDSAWRSVTVHSTPAGRGEHDAPDRSAPLLQAHPGVPVRRTQELKPRAVTEPRPGVFIFDLGQNMVGWARLVVSGPVGTTVRLRFGEVLNPDGTLYTANLRGARATDTYLLRGQGREVWEPRFTFHGFRYVEVTGYPGRPTPAAITGVVVHSDAPPVGTFRCSNALVNQLQQNIEWGQRGNFLEVPTDCPQRDERLGWTGDAQVFARTAGFQMDVARFFGKWIIDLVDAQREDGAFTDVAPFVAAGAGTAGWGDAGVIVPWTLYELYGDTRLLERHYDAFARWIAYLERNSSDLLRPARGYGDWVAVGSRTPTDVIATAYFAYSASLVAQIARALGRDADAHRYDDLFARVRAAFNRAYVAPDGRIKGDTQTCYVLALHMDLLPPETRPAAVRHLVEDIERRGNRLSTGFLGTAYLLPVLSRFGHTDLAYRLLLQEEFPSWGYTVRRGATTIWERWDGITPEGRFQDPGMNSFNHFAFGSVGEWLYRVVAGIDLDPKRPGFRHVVIRPQPGGGLTWVRATYRSIRGPIASSWRQEGGRFTLHVSLPANTTATVHVPAPSAQAVTEGGRPAHRAPGLRFLGMAGAAAVFHAGSGDYRFVVESR